MSIFDFKRMKYRTFLQDSETGEEIAEEYEKGRGVWKKHDVQDGKGSEMRENLIRKHYWFSGRVQGVGFRYRACYIASSLGVTGWVRNNWDDRVEMEAQGSRELLAHSLTYILRYRESSWMTDSGAIIQVSAFFQRRSSNVIVSAEICGLDTEESQRSCQI